MLHFTQIIRIHIGTICGPLLVDIIFPHFYEIGFIKKLIKDKIITEAKAFNLTFR